MADGSAPRVDFANAIRQREPGDDDDVGEFDADLVPLGLVLREIELDQREELLVAGERTKQLEAHLHSRMRELARRTLWAVRNGKHAPSPAWDLLGELEVEQQHGGVERVWVPRAGHPQCGEWMSQYRQRCTFKACRVCGVAA